MKSNYFTIEKPIEEVLFKEKNSKFIGFCFPIEHENQVKEILEQLKKTHSQANHCCFAYQIGYEASLKWRANDDGEPSHTAGTPILGQINSKDLTNVLVAVIRYFGGTKLGVGGLINAYKTTAKLALDQATIIQKNICTQFEIQSNYLDLNKVMRLIKIHQLKIIKQEMADISIITIEVPIHASAKIKNILTDELRLIFEEKK